MNRCFSARVVETLPGGARERGARLSETGRDVLAAYRALEAAAAHVADGDPYRLLVAALRDVPLPPTR